MSKDQHAPTLVWVVLVSIIFFLVLALASGIVLRNEHHQHVQFTEELAKGQMEIIASIAEAELQKGNYESLSKIINQWAAKYSEVDEIKLVSRNGFIIAGYGPVQSSVRRYI
ncbi:MAG: hypothetical protein ABW145_04740, partial [Candidatus Thiodiazotropha sp.]